jgi:hypothetical protein
MKTALKVLMLVLLAGYSCAAFAGLVGFLPASAFLTSEVTRFLYSAVGIMFIGLNDCGCRGNTMYHV